MTKPKKFLINTIVDAQPFSSGEAWKLLGDVEDLPEGFNDLHGYIVTIHTPRGSHPLWIPTVFFEAISSEVI
ncbi:hypothetical protein [Vibrio cholerae]|uniref:hypothetical protein n=1 Tax=Vibrio cholerae TaxID=666 RepID=UPI003F9BD95D